MKKAKNMTMQSTTCKNLMYADQYGRHYTEDELNSLPSMVFQIREFHVLKVI